MKWFLAFLMAYLSPGVEEDFAPEPDEPADEPDEPDEPADEPDEPSEPDDDDTPAPAPRLSRAQRDIIAARERAQQAERDLATARAELEVARRAPQQQTPTQDQLLWQQEEAVLNNPDAEGWQKYAVQANRAARAAQSDSRTALQRAEDLADRTSFAVLASTKPKLYAAYKDRVEDKLKDLRSKGNNAPREALLALMVGEDMLSGKLKANKTGTAKTGAAPRASVRSDVTAAPGGGRMSDHEKRAKRLENIRI